MHHQARDSPSLTRHHCSVGFLEQLRSDLKRAALEQQGTLVVHLLRKKFASLTFDDLRALLASPLGRGLGPLRVAELTTQESSTTKTRTPTTAPAKTSGSSKKPKAKKSKAKKPKAKTSRSTAKGPSKRKNVAPAVLAAVLAALEKERAPIRGPALAAKLKVHRTTVRVALARLLAAGKVTTVGPPTRLSYSIKPSESPVPANSDTTSRPKPAKTKVAKATKAKVTTRTAPAGSPRPPSDTMQGGQAGYDGAVLAVIRTSGTGVASSTIQTSVGGTIDQVRAALHRLMEAGQIIRTGERKFTRYELPARA